MKKKIKITSLLFLALLTVTILIINTFPSCEVGMGGAVDVEAPSVRITYPPDGSIIRDKFILAGTCADDQGVKKIEVVIRNGQGDVVEAYTPPKVQIVKSKTWSTTINEKIVQVNEKGEAIKGEDGKEVSSYPLKDGDYIFEATSIDKSGRKSKVSHKISVKIDNTPPIFILKSPGSIDIQNPTPYGCVLKVEGSIAEQNSVKSLKLKIFTPDNLTTPLTEWEERDINIAGTTSVTFAKYTTDITKQDGELYKRYVKSSGGIYDLVKAGSYQSFKCSVELTDSSGVYQTPTYTLPASSVAKGTTNKEENKEEERKEEAPPVTNTQGNATTKLYLNNDIYGADAGSNALLGSAAESNIGKALEISDILKIVNKTYSGNLSEAQLDKINKILTKTATDTTYIGQDKKDTLLAIKLNNRANPTYSILGAELNLSDLTQSTQVAKGGNLTFKAQAGLDNTEFLPEKLNVYVFGPLEPDKFTKENLDKYYNSTSEMLNLYDEYEKNPQEFLKTHEGNVPIKYYKIFDGESVKGAASVAVFPKALSLVDGEGGEIDIGAGNNFIVVATGEDKDSVEFINEFTNDGGNKYFGFVSHATESSAGLEIINPINDEVYNDCAEPLIVKARIKTSDPSSLSNLQFDLKVTDGSNKDKVDNLTYKMNKSEIVKSWKAATDEWGGYILTLDLKSLDWEELTNTPLLCPGAKDAQRGQSFRYILSLTINKDLPTQTVAQASFTVDKMFPILTVTSIAPQVSQIVRGEDGELHPVQKLNGFIEVIGNVKDNVLLKPKDTIIVSIWKTDGEDTSKDILVEKGLDGGGLTFSQGAGDNSNYLDFHFYIDSTNICKTVGKYRVKGRVEDAYGNVWEGYYKDKTFNDVTFTIDQRTDEPIVSFNNMDGSIQDDAKGAGGEEWLLDFSNKNKEKSNIFGMGSNIIYFNVTDDDGISTIKYYIDNTLLNTVDCGGDTSKSLEVPLDTIQIGGKELLGTHKFKVVVEDIKVKEREDGNGGKVRKGETDYAIRDTGSIYFARDNKAPTITIENIETTDKNNKKETKPFKANMLLPSAWTLTGRASDDGELVSITDSLGGGIAYNKAAGTWKLVVTGEADGKGKVRVFSALDKYGRSSAVTATYTIDTKDPIFNTDKITLQGENSTEHDIKLSDYLGTSYDRAATWFRTPTVTIKGAAAAITEDTLDSIKGVVNNNTASPVTVNILAENGFEGRFNLTEGKDHKIKLTAGDQAGNSSNLQDISLNVDSTPPLITLDTGAGGAVVNEYSLKDGEAGLGIRVKIKDGMSGLQQDLLGAGAVKVLCGKEEITSNISITSPSTEADIYTINLTKSSTMLVAGNTYTYTISVKDKAGNEATSDIITVYATDKPAITFNVGDDRITDFKYVGEGTHADGTVKGNRFGMGNNTIRALITDNDGISKVKYSILSEAGDVVEYTNGAGAGEDCNGVLTKVLEIPLDKITLTGGAQAGSSPTMNHKLKVEVTDTKHNNQTFTNETIKEGICFAFDNEEPLFKGTKIEIGGVERDYSNMMYLPDTFDIKGIVSDDSNVASVTLKGDNTDLLLADTTGLGGKERRWKLVCTGEADSTGTPPKSVKVFVVKDIYDREKELSLSYVIDKTPPVFNGSYITFTAKNSGQFNSDGSVNSTAGEEVAYRQAGSLWFRSESVTLKGAAGAITEANPTNTISVQVQKAGEVAAQNARDVTLEAGNTFDTTLNLKEGEDNKVILKFSDKAGLPATFPSGATVTSGASPVITSSLVLKVDSTSPTVTNKKNAAGQDLTYNIAPSDQNVPIYITLTDATSGINVSSIVVKKGREVLTSSTDSTTNPQVLITQPTDNGSTVTNGEYTLTIKRDDAADLLKAGRDYTFTVTVSDKAGNSATSGEITVFATDTPTLTSINPLSSTVTTTAGISPTANLLGIGSSSINLSLSDNDGLNSVKWTIYKEDGTTKEYEKTINALGKSLITDTIKINDIDNDSTVTKTGSPSYSGTHFIEITATDSLHPDQTTANTYTSPKIAFAYDDDNPIISVSSVDVGGGQVKQYSAGLFLPTTFTIKGSISDKSGIKGVTFIKTEDNTGGGSTTTITPAVTFDSTVGTWQAVVTNIGEGNWKSKFKVADKYGRENETEATYIVDTLPPSFDTSKISFIDNTLGGVPYANIGSTWFRNRSITLKGATGAIVENNPDTLTYTVLKSGETAGTVRNAVLDSGNSFDITLGLSDGEANKVLLTVADKASHSVTLPDITTTPNARIVLKVDSTSPTISYKKGGEGSDIKEYSIRSDESEVTIYLTAEDATSKINGSNIVVNMGKTALYPLQTGTSCATITKPSGNSDGEYAIKITGDGSTILKHGTESSFTVTFTDNAGNTATSEEIIVHSTDKPSIKFDKLKTTILNSGAVDKNNNLFNTTTDKIISGDVEDKDGIKAIKYFIDPSTDTNGEVTLDSNGEPNTSAASGTISGITGSPTTHSFEIDLSTIQIGGKGIKGTHSIYMQVEDSSECSNKLTTANIYFGVDNNLPSFTATIGGEEDIKVDGKAYEADSWYSNSFTITGTVCDDVEVKRVYNASDADKNTLLNSGSLTTWKDSVTETDGKGRSRSYIVEDIYGKTSTYTLTYNVDATPPVLQQEHINIIGANNSDKPSKISIQEYQTKDGTLLGDTTQGEVKDTLRKIWFRSNRLTIEGESNSSDATKRGLVEAYPKEVKITVTKKVPAGETAPDPNINTTSANSNGGFSATFELYEGEQTVLIEVFDYKGNKDTKSLTIHCDSQAPINLTASHKVTGFTKEDSIEVTIDGAEDTVSRIKSVLIGTQAGFQTGDAIGSLTYSGGNSAGTPPTPLIPPTRIDSSIASSTTDTVKASVECDISGLGDGEHTLYARAIDVAGNATNDMAITNKVSIDRTAPTVKIISPSDNAVVNKTVKLTGTVSDTNLFREEDSSLQGYEGRLPKVYMYDATVTGDGSKWVECPAQVANSSSVSGNTWETSIDTMQLKNTQGAEAKYFYVSITDKAGNAVEAPTLTTAPTEASHGNSHMLKIDQDTDRPVITLSNINTAHSIISDHIITGSVTDDDGAVKGIWKVTKKTFEGSGSDPAYTEANYPILNSDGSVDKKGWKETTSFDAGSGSWTIDFGTGGGTRQEWVFAVMDATGQVFVTTNLVTGSNALNRVYLTDRKTAKQDSNNGVSFTYDKTAPTVKVYVAGVKTLGTAPSITAKWEEPEAGKTFFFGKDTILYAKVVVTETESMNDDEPVHHIGLKDNTAAFDKTTNPCTDNVTLSFAGEDIKNTNIEQVSMGSVGSGSSSNQYIYLFTPITLDDTWISGHTGQKGMLQLSASVYDAVNHTGRDSININIDTEPPMVDFVTPAMEDVEADPAGTAFFEKTTIAGLTVDEISGVKSVKWAVPVNNAFTSSTVDGKEVITITDDTLNDTPTGPMSWKAPEGTLSSWKIIFNSGLSTSPSCILYYVTNGNETKYHVHRENNGLFQVPIWFLVEDEVGNKAVITDKYVYVDPDAGKPTAKIISPEDGAVTSGTITLYGSALDRDGSVTEVWLKITGANGTPFDMSGVSGYDANVDNKDGTKGAIKVTGTTSWKCSFNPDTSGLSDGASLELNLSVRAVDNDNNTRPFTTPISITVNNNSPTLTNLRLVQYGAEFDATFGKATMFDSNNTVTTETVSDTDGNTSTILKFTDREANKEVPYENGMYISGRDTATNGSWYLVGDVAGCDDTITLDRVVGYLDCNWDRVNEVNAPGTLAANKKTNYILRLPLDTSDPTARIYYKIALANNANTTSKMQVQINIDSTPPTLYTKAKTGSLDGDLRVTLSGASEYENMLGEEKTTQTTGTATKTITTTIQESNGGFSFGDSVEEADSGLDFVAFYFERRGKDDHTSRVYYPNATTADVVDGRTGLFTYVETEGDGSYKAKQDGTVYMNEDGLPALYLEEVARENATGDAGDGYLQSPHLAESSGGVRIQQSIHEGSLVKIAGTYHLIESVGTDGSITFTPPVNKLYTSAEVILAEVVDKLGAQEGWDGVTNKVNGDSDGDGLSEKLKLAGISYNWIATIHAKNIPDGKVTLHVTAVDKAGNVSKGFVNTKLENNAPRITHVLLATDLNGNGSFEYDATKKVVQGNEDTVGNTSNGAPFGEFTYFNASPDGSALSVVNLRTSNFKVKDRLCLLPEFAGGNGKVKYILTRQQDPITEPIKLGNAVASGTVTDTGNGTDPVVLKPLLDSTVLASNVPEDKAAELIKPVLKNIGTPVDDAYSIDSLVSTQGGIVLRNDKENNKDANGEETGGWTKNHNHILDTDGLSTLSFTFYDETEEAEQGVDSQYSILNIPINNLSNDTVHPEVAITPFYWTSKDNNSVYYEGGVPQGHIELEEDLKWQDSGGNDFAARASAASLPANECDYDPKVSGKIVLRGKVSDNIRLKEVNIEFATGTNTELPIKLASYNLPGKTGEWNFETTSISGGTGLTKALVVNDEGHYIKFTKDELTEEGHECEYEIILDTEKIEWTGSTYYMAALNKLIYVTATDWRGGQKNEDGTQTASGALTNRYQVDIVPYITSLTTAFSKSVGDIFARSAKGEYEVRAGEEGININGFNIGDSGFTVHTTGYQNSLSHAPTTIPADCKSGDLYVKVTNGSIHSLNNLNRNPVRKVTTGEEVATSFEGAALYNSQANGVNNDLLDDDIKINVWATDKFVDRKDINDPSFKMAPNGNYYMMYDNSMFTNLAGNASHKASILAFNYNGSASSFSDIDGSFNKFLHTAIAIENGKIFGVSSNSDRQNDLSAKFKFYLNWNGNTFPAETVQDDGKTPKYRNYYLEGGSYSKILETMHNSATKVYDINRFPRPKMVAKASSTSGHSEVYLIYYDQNHDNSPIRFRYGDVNNSDKSITSGLRGYNGNSTNSGQIDDPRDIGNVALGDCPNSTSSASRFDVIADSTKTTTYSGSQYCAIGILNNGTPVVAWHDSKLRSLIYSWREKPASNFANTQEYGGVWQSHAQVIDSDNAGWYVDMFVDSANGVHIAYYNNASGDLKYAYIPAYDQAGTQKKVVTVDSYLSTGTQISIETRDETIGGVTYIVPYITYYNQSFSQTPNCLRVASLSKAIKKSGATAAENMESVKPGAVNDKYTHYWQVSTPPLTEGIIPKDYTISIGLPTYNNRSTHQEYGTSPVIAFWANDGYRSAYMQTQ